MSEKKDPDNMRERVKRSENVDEMTESKTITNSLNLDERQARSILVQRAKNEDTDIVDIEESESYEFATKLRKELNDYI